MKLQPGEELLIKEGRTGWGNTLAVTNKRLLILDRDKIVGETLIENVAGAYAETQVLTGLTQLKIKLKDGREMPVIFRSSANGFLYGGGSENAGADLLNLTNRYVEAITRAISEQLPTKEV
ncbi:MAG: hypothetical protein NWE99_07450 [Candidatus Bathyarchaeota archaeon]|nr:hypothetical protein [Candidatus Bathyarchaeota archaeon]